MVCADRTRSGRRSHAFTNSRQIEHASLRNRRLCEPVHKEFAAGLARNSAVQIPGYGLSGPGEIRNPQPAITGTYQAHGSVVRIAGRIEPATVRPGESAQLIITATPPPTWHVYAYSPRDNKPGSKPTLIAFADTSGLIPNRRPPPMHRSRSTIRCRCSGRCATTKAP